MRERWAHRAAIVGAVALQALHDWNAERIALLHDGSPEAELAAGILAATLGESRLVRVTAPPPGLESLLQNRGASDDFLAAELLRLRARLLPGALLATPLNKTALLLGGPLPPEPLLPLGDVYASEVHELTGSWSGPAAVRDLAQRAGGIDRLDAVLRNRFERRDPAAFDELEPELKHSVETALAGGRASRVSHRVVPKLGARTIGVDLFE